MRGMGAGVLAGKMKAEKGYLLLFYDALTLIPIGQAIYGCLFEILEGKAFGLFFIVTVLVVLLAFAMKKPFARLAEFIEK